MDIKDYSNKDLCLVIGNGPSLKGFDLFRTKNFSTLGMNAAYRYWDRIGWYPDYYCCLDDQLIETHHNEIARLYRDGHIKTFFLHQKFYNFHPEFLQNPDFFSLDQFLPHRKKQCEELGIECYFEHPVFAGTDTTKVTTGAYAVRFIAFRGYLKIALMGIDLIYEEILPGARQGEGCSLVMEKTPSNNPNYFFDDYQQSGDKYNIPNPSVHNGELHPKSFELIRDDFRRNDVRTDIVNTNSKSILYQRKIFPFEAISIVLGEPLLGSIFVPTRIEERERILKNFFIWSQAEFLPTIEETDPVCRLVFVFNNEAARDIEEEIRQSFFTHGMDRFFSKLEFIYLKLASDEDRYTSDYTKPVGSEGYKAGPNNQFFKAISALSDKGLYALLMETDCVPIRANWLSQLQKICTNHPPFWVLGSAYRGCAKLSSDFQHHINGNAIYAAGDPHFQEFANSIWLNYTKKFVEEKNPTLAYDCILDKLFSDKNIQETVVWKVWQESAHKFHYTDYIQNISCAADAKNLDMNWFKSIRSESLNTYLVHSKKALEVTLEYIDSKILSETICTNGDELNETQSSIDFPRLLVIDMTLMGDGTATGELKFNLLSNWPTDHLCQIFRNGLDKIGFRQFSLDNPQYFIPEEFSQLNDLIVDFNPDVILYRPTPNTKLLHSFAMDLIQKLEKSLVTWIMDDWPENLRVTDPEQYQELNADLRYLLKLSSKNFAISEKMSHAFERRYDTKFIPLANGVKLEEWAKDSVCSDSEHVRIRYCGSLASNMVLESVIKIASAIEKIAKTEKVIFEINTTPIWKDKGELFEGFSSTIFVAQKKSQEEYRKWLQGANVVVIAYNFDESSLIYTQYSLANKLPECLASGAATLAFGPYQSYSIEYLKKVNCASVVDSDSKEELEGEILKLVRDSDYRELLVNKARAVVADKHDLVNCQRLLKEVVTDAFFSPAKPIMLDHAKQYIQDDQEIVTLRNLNVCVFISNKFNFIIDLPKRIKNKLAIIYNVFIIVWFRSIFKNISGI